MTDPVEILLPEIRSLRQSTEEGFQAAERRSVVNVAIVKTELNDRMDAHEAVIGQRFVLMDKSIHDMHLCVESLKGWQARLGGVWVVVWGMALLVINAAIAIGVGIAVTRVSQH